MYNTHHMSETPKKRGRKKGSTSFTKIRLKDLSDPAPAKIEETEERIEFTVNTFK